jgi:hypothetical protein
MPDYALFDPSSGERTGSLPAPGQKTGPWSGPDPSGADWSAHIESENPVEASPPYGPGLGLGPLPCNIQGGELRADDDGDDLHDQPCCEDDCDDSGPVPANIVRSSRSHAVITTTADLGRR